MRFSDSEMGAISVIIHCFFRFSIKVTFSTLTIKTAKSFISNLKRNVILLWSRYQVSYSEWILDFEQKKLVVSFKGIWFNLHIVIPRMMQSFSRTSYLESKFNFNLTRINKIWRYYQEYENNAAEDGTHRYQSLRLVVSCIILLYSVSTFIDHCRTLAMCDMGNLRL